MKVKISSSHQLWLTMMIKLSANNHIKSNDSQSTIAQRTLKRTQSDQSSLETRKTKNQAHITQQLLSLTPQSTAKTNKMTIIIHLNSNALQLLWIKANATQVKTALLPLLYLEIITVHPHKNRQALILLDRALDSVDSVVDHLLLEVVWKQSNLLWSP